MAINATTYLVETKYLVDDKASRALGGIGKKADEASRSTGALKRHLLGLGAAALGGGLFLGVKKAFVDFNSSVEQSLISLSSTMLGFGAVKSFDAGMTRSTKLLAEYQEVAKTSVGETKDFVAMHQSIAGPLMNAGMTMGQIKKVAIGATVAAQIMGEQAEMTALDIKQMAMGSMTARDRVGGMLVGMLAAQKGMKNFGYEQWNKLSQAKRNAMLMESVQSPALAAGAKAMGGSFAGVLSTLKDNISLALGKAGLPLFKAITAEIKGWSGWIETHQVEVQNMIRSLGSHLKSAFGFVKGVFTFIVNHKDTLLSIAKAFLVFKGIKFGVGLVKGGVQGIAGMISNAAAAFGNAGNASATLATRMTAAAGIIGSAGAALGSLVVLWTEHQIDKIDREQNARARYGVFTTDAADMEARTGAAKFGSQGFDNRSYMAAARRTLQSARDSGILDAKGNINDRALRAAANAVPDADIKGFGHESMVKYIATLRTNLVNALEAERVGAIKTFKKLQETGEVAAAALRATTQAIALGLFGQAGAEFWGLTKPSDSDRANARDNINVHIAKVEVPAKDPDRWIIDLGKFAAKQVRAPRQARGALRR